jgi:hypothetical protein
MGFKFNPFTGTLDVVDGTGVTTYASYASLPGSASDGALAITLDTDKLYVFDSATSTWKLIGPQVDLVSFTQYGGF